MLITSGVQSASVLLAGQSLLQHPALQQLLAVLMWH